MLLLKFYFYFIIGVNSFEIKGFQKSGEQQQLFRNASPGKSYMTPYPGLHIHVSR